MADTTSVSIAVVYTIVMSDREKWPLLVSTCSQKRCPLHRPTPRCCFVIFHSTKRDKRGQKVFCTLDASPCPTKKTKKDEAKSGGYCPLLNNIIIDKTSLAYESKLKIQRNEIIMNMLKLYCCFLYHYVASSTNNIFLINRQL